MSTMEQSISQNILSQKSFQQALYTDFFGITENPFSLTPDPKYFYLSSKHKEALAHLYFGLKERQGFIAITGEVGTGKTTLCRAFLDQLAPEYDVAYILNPCFTALELLQNINREFGIHTDSGQGKKELFDRLNQFLLEKKLDNRTVIVIIDEAQNLEPEVLEQIRLISNLETTREKLIQIVLIGQPELNILLSSHSLRQLNQRILFRWHIDPLDLKETSLYIEHRLKIASVHGTIAFDDDALKAIYHHTSGIPRLINVLSHRAMLIAYAYDQKKIDQRIVNDAAKDINIHQSLPQKKSLLKTFKKPLVAVLLLFMIILLSVSTLYRDINIISPVSENDDTHIDKIQADMNNKNIEADMNNKNIQIEETEKRSQSDLLISELREITEVESLNISNKKILSTWSGLLSPEQSEEPDLSLYDFTGTLDELKKFNLPSVVEITIDGGKRFITLERLENDNAVVSVKKQFTIPYSELKSLFSGNARIYWMDFEKLNPYLSPGDKGIQIKWLQLNLKELGFMISNPTSVFDLTTVKAVTDFQNTYGLEPDGIVGPATKMLFYSQLRNTYPAPLLMN